MFELISDFAPAGDQTSAIAALLDGLNHHKHNQVLLGVTGSGKTFTMANVIAKANRPALIIAHNKTLAAQLYGEMRAFFPKNAVEYFVSYYDYYQPEAYIPQRDVYIEKDSRINEQIDRMRHSATRALLERKDVIVVASVSCIYGLGAPELYLQMTYKIQKGQKIPRDHIMKQLIALQYSRNDVDFHRGTFRVRGDCLDIYPSHYQDQAWRICMFGSEIEEIYEIDALTNQKSKNLSEITVFANSHYITPRPTLEQAITLILQELQTRIKYLRDNGQLVEAQRLEQRTVFDMEMIKETGTCKGIENYSRYLSGRNAGDPPPTLFEYLPENALLVVDESHVTIPQIGAMYNGDRARKSNLVEYGFRLPSALDNRPLTFAEWDNLRPSTVFVSATPGQRELEWSNGQYIAQIIRPTGLLDPICEVRPAGTQIDDLLAECAKERDRGLRVLVTTLTKRMAEDLANYLTEIGLKAIYLHSEIKTLERIDIIQDLRRGTHDVLVGVNLLREGLDIPECGLVAILDADKEGFLRSENSLIQTIGRAARNASGRVIMYADKMTAALDKALAETNRRRELQMAYNTQHGITPRTIHKSIGEIINYEDELREDEKNNLREILRLMGKNPDKYIEKLHKQMLKAAHDMDFEKAAQIRDQIHAAEKALLLREE